MKPKRQYLSSARVRECGAAILMVYVAILAFLFFAVLALDVPFMERTGRSIQRAVDAAALAGTVQLTRKGPPVNPRPDPANDAIVWPDPETLIGWQRAKRAVFQNLQQNQMVGAVVGLNINPAAANRSGDIDPFDDEIYGRERYSFEVPAGTVVATMQVERGVYERPLSWLDGIGNPEPIFYPVELDDPSRVNNNCVPTLPALAPAGLAVPRACRESPHRLDAADSVHVTMTLMQVPTLFAKIFGVDIFTDITRTGIAGPEVAGGVPAVPTLPPVGNGGSVAGSSCTALCGNSCGDSYPVCGYNTVAAAYGCFCADLRTMYGCFAPGTKILKADKSYEPIEALRVGDSVFSPISGKNLAIKKIIVGPEKEALVKIGFAGKAILVTSKHPMYTSEGIVKAEELKVGHTLVSSDGGLQTVESIERQALLKDQQVWNIELETDSEDPKDRMLVAEGVVSGDFKVQGMLESGSLQR